MAPNIDQPKKTFQKWAQSELFIYAADLGELSRKVRDLTSGVADREHQIDQLVGFAVAIREDTRQRIACELHDRVAQTLATVFQYLEALGPTTEPGSAVNESINRARELLKEAIRESRNIMDDLYPRSLDGVGLVTLTREELRRFKEYTGCKTGLSAQGRVKPPRNVEGALYRILHEALTNIKRHARGVNRVTARVKFSRRSVTLGVEDDGCGFDVKVVRQHLGGLVTMRQRAEQLGGTCEIVSCPGRGTAVNISIPLPPGGGKRKRMPTAKT